MAKHYVRQRDTKGTLARVERNVRIARAAGARFVRAKWRDEWYRSPRSAELLPFLSPIEREARNEMSPGVWMRCFREGLDGPDGV